MDFEWIKTFTQYHIDMTRRVWDSIEHITDEQFLADHGYSQGSIHSLIVHIISTDRRWLAGLKNQSDVGHLNAEEYSTRAAARKVFEDIATEWAEYIPTLTSDDLNQHTDQVAEPRWQILLHLVNHGTDHRATILQKLHELGAPTFPQDFIIWLWERK